MHQFNNNIMIINLLLTSENVTKHHFNDIHSFRRFLAVCTIDNYVCTSRNIVIPELFSSRAVRLKGWAKPD